MPSPRVPLACLIGFGLCWTALAIAPAARGIWLLENVPTLVVVPVLVATYRRFRFSDRAYVMLALFLLLHTIGSHYTYPEVPVGEWARGMFGGTRNQYDRYVHFAYGLLLFVPARELIFRKSQRLRLWPELSLTFAALACGSLLYELSEWLSVTVVAPHADESFLGTQGDAWDAQKDMGVAALGSLLAALYEWARARRANVHA